MGLCAGGVSGVFRRPGWGSPRRVGGHQHLASGSPPLPVRLAPLVVRTILPAGGGEKLGGGGPGERGFFPRAVCFSNGAFRAMMLL
jgi:hypothetical protein